MGYLAWLFFCISPFALFCSEDGNGLILCPVFIILGFVFKWIENNSGKPSRAVVKIDPKDFWEWHYKDRMRSMYVQKDSGNEKRMTIHDQEAREWATTVCGYHNAWIPPESTQEQIARANGVVTTQMIKERKEKHDRIQVGKYILMCELEKKYCSTKIGKDGHEKCCSPQTYIAKDKDKIRLSDSRHVKWAKSKYDKSIFEIWENVSEEEKKQATKWVEEYEKKLINLCNEYVYGDLCDIDVEIDF